MAAPRVSKAERFEKTRRALLDEARTLFAERGYTDTSIEDVAKGAKVTRGAAYHHFRDKAALFEAVYHEEQDAFIQFIAQRAQKAEGDLWERFVVTPCHAFIERAADPGFQRILHVDGPAVLGRAALEKSGSGMELTQQVYEIMMTAGMLKPLPVGPLIHLLWVLFFEAGLYIANASDPEKAQEDMLTTMLGVIDGLRVSPEPGEGANV